MKVFASVAIGVAVLSITAQPFQAAEAPSVRAVLQSEKDRKPALNFELKDVAGKSVKLSDYRGKVLLLNFWATWCGGCKLEMPWFQEFQTALGSGRFAVVGVSLDQEGWAAVKPYVEKSGMTYRMALADKSTTDGYAVTSLPATFLIDSQGRIAASYIGLVDKSDVETNINTLLGKRR
jgi:cytochrome c biogenesis protein CcmG/thiol:disulfide interchange protein DsbE